MNTLRLENITKHMGSETVLSGINMQMQGGRIYGIVGKNGSGKSMLLRAIADLIHLDEGTIFYNDTLVKKGLPREARVGLIIENVNLHMDLSAMENLTYLAKINKYISEKQIRESLLRVNLDPENKKKIKTYSLGMRQKLIIAQAIMEQPEVLLLDEPTNALDEASVQKLHQILREESERGAIILVVSHNREDIEQLCEKVFIMNAGVLTEEKDK